MINLNTDNDMPTLLEDFTLDELMFLDLTVKEKLQDCIRSVDLASQFQDGTMKEEILNHYNKRIEMATQWLTKIYEAELEARSKEIIKSN